jgi:hypothetical protein
LFVGRQRTSTISIDPAHSARSEYPYLAIFSAANDRRRHDVAILKIIQPPVTKDVYDAVSAKVDTQGDPPAGLILHCAGEANGTLQIIEVWESEEHADRFADERLSPAIGQVAGEGAPNRAQAEVASYELHNLIRP